MDRLELGADWRRLGLLILLALILRVWIVARTEVAARDSVGYIRYALHFEDRPWADVIRSHEQHPGYPLLILAVSKPVRWLSGGLSCDAMVLSAQIVSAISGVLLVIPVFYLGKLLFSRTAGFLAALLLQGLPVIVQITSDGLSEGPFLLALTTGLLAGVRGMRTRSPWQFLLAGGCAGVAYWIRPEGEELAIATGLVLSVAGSLAWGVRATFVRGLALTTGLVPCVALYVGTTGHLSNKPTPRGILQGEPIAPQAGAGMRGPLFAVFWSAGDSQESRTVWALRSVAKEAVKTLNYALPGLVLLGMWWFRHRWRQDAALWIPTLLAVFHAILLWRMAVVIGYVSERHTLPIALVATLWAGAAIPELARRLLLWSPHARYLPAALTGLLVLAGLPAHVRPLHSNRAGHHAAGVWMASQITDRDEVIDPFCWSHFYAGRVFREGKDQLAPLEERTRYVVIEQSDNPHSRLPWYPIAKELAKRGERVYSWPEGRSPEKAHVVVYRVPPPQ